MEWYEALILGIIQGLTEFLPISSSGHLEIASFLLKTNPSNNLFFTVLVHIATAISIIYVFKKDIYAILSGLVKFNKNEIEFTTKIIVSSIPVGIIGLMYEKKNRDFIYWEHDTCRFNVNSNLFTIIFYIFFEKGFR